MKKIGILIISLVLSAAGFTGQAQTSSAVPTASQTTAEAATEYVDFFFNGLSLKVPQGAPISMEGNEAVLKTPDGSFGFSLKTEKDKKASATGAYELCKRVVTDLHIQQAQLTKVNINGLEGACVDGTLEGVHVAVTVLADGHRYVKLVVICAPSHASWARTVIQSVRKN